MNDRIAFDYRHLYSENEKVDITFEQYFGARADELKPTLPILYEHIVAKELYIEFKTFYFEHHKDEPDIVNLYLLSVITKNFYDDFLRWGIVSENNTKIDVGFALFIRFIRLFQDTEISINYINIVFDYLIWLVINSKTKIIIYYKYLDKDTKAILDKRLQNYPEQINCDFHDNFKEDTEFRLNKADSIIYFNGRKEYGSYIGYRASVPSLSKKNNKECTTQIIYKFNKE